jgi:hypothetical protein
MLRIIKMSNNNENQLPVGKIQLINPFPNVQLSNKIIDLSKFADKICVIHLYTG